MWHDVGLRPDLKPEADRGGAGALAGQRGAGSGCSPSRPSSGREGRAVQRAARCRCASLCCGATVCSVCGSAPPARCVHVSDLPPAEVLQSSRQKVQEARVGGGLICPCLPLLSWGRGRNSQETVNSPRGWAHLSTLLLFGPQ